jgi:hypothetical protein
MNEDKLYNLFEAYNGLKLDTGWVFEYDSRAGSVGITNGEYMVYCTPFWEDMNGIPVSDYDTGYSSFIPVDKPKSDEEVNMFFDDYLSNKIPFIIMTFERFLQDSFHKSE